MIDEKLIHSKVLNTLYVHDSFSSMFRGFLNWFQDGFDQRFNYKVMSTYDKAVQFFNQKRKSRDGNNSTNILPSITLDPNLDFTNEDRGGKFPWMFPNLDPVHGRYFTRQIDLKEQGVTVSIMRTRYSGTCDVTFWLSSVYELFDIRTKLIQYCNGIGRWIRPQFFWTHVILPKEIIEFKRPTDGKKLDWSATPVEVVQLSTTNSKEYGIPFPLNAMWRLDSLSDGSTKYGADQLTEWKFTATFTWECDIPTFVRLDNYSFYDMHPTLHFGIGPTYSSQPLMNKISNWRLLNHTDLLRKYIGHSQVYTLSEYKSPFIKMDETQCNRFPTFYKEYNHIVSAKCYEYDELEDLDRNDQFPDEFIFLMDRYEDRFLNYLRRSSGCICRLDDDKSEFYTLVSSLNLPTICSISEKLYKALQTRKDIEITMDPVTMCIYAGKIETTRLDVNDINNKKNYQVCKVLLDYFNKHNVFQDKRFRNLDLGDAELVSRNRTDIIGKYDPKISEYTLKTPISSTIQKSFKLYVANKYVPRTMYTLESNKITFNDDVTFPEYSEIKCTIEGYIEMYTVLNAINYSITKEDERNFYTKAKKIEIDIPNGYDTDYIKCCSYNGLLDEHSDYEVNSDKTKIIFNIEPQRDKVIQVFMNRTRF